MAAKPSPKTDADRSLEKLREHQAILRDFARVAAEATNVDRLLEFACQHAACATSVHHAKLMRHRSDKSDLLVVAGVGWKPGVVGHARIGADMSSPAGRCYQTREVCRVDDIMASADLRCPEILSDHGIHALCNAPITVKGVVWGVLEVDSTVPGRFDEDDERFLEALALVLAQALRHHATRDERERDAEDAARRLLRAETLMREQNHRVRNYFQMILSILAARSARATDDQVRHDYREVMDRVTAVALAHDQLIVDRCQTSVNAATYLDALCSGVERTMGDKFRIDRRLEPIDLRPDRAVPLGLVVNELVTNSLKYAVKGRGNGYIGVMLDCDQVSKTAVLEVADNGPGMGEQRPGSQGLRLVRSLAGQLSGRVEIESSADGTTVRVTFPLYD